MFDTTDRGPSLRPLKGVKVVVEQPPAAGCSSQGGSGRSGCGAAAGPGDLPAQVWEKVKNHPCYSEEAHHHFARMHVAVAPACNIQCNYCNRKYDCANESRPGVVSERLTPEQAAKKVLAVAAEIPQLSVVGIAGPGDPLANPARTFRTFELIARAAPDLRLCVSTNGLALPAVIDELSRYRIDHVTITINAVDPRVGARIYPWIFYQHRRHRGEDAARLLLEQQLRGLELLTARGILAKINSVLIPGINDEHLIEVNREVKRRGAFLHNIMPLISAPEHGTVFGLAGQRGPSAQELKRVQDACEGGANLMRHCRQCRADAVGLLGDDRADEFTVERIEAMTVDADPAARDAYRRQVEVQRAQQRAAKEAETAELARASGAEDVALLVAVASSGGGKINQHFGHATELKIYEVDRRGARFVGHRRIDHYCQGGWGEDDALPSIVRAINDCHAVLVAKIGRCPREELAQARIEAVEDHAFEYIEQGVLGYYRRYLERLRAGEIEHRPRSGAEHAAAIRQGALTAAPAARAA